MMWNKNEKINKQIQLFATRSSLLIADLCAILKYCNEIA